MEDLLPFIVVTLLNISCSKGISIANKITLSGLGVSFAPTLTLAHLIATTAYTAPGFRGLLANLSGKDGSVNKALIAQITIIAILNALSIVLMITSLGQNSLGFSQLAKLTSIPCTLLIQYLWYGDKFSSSTIASLSFMLVGIFIASWSDPEFNVKGTYTAGAAVPVTSIVQVMSSKVQKGNGKSLTSQQYMLTVFSMSGMTLAIALWVLGLGWNLGDAQQEGILDFQSPTMRWAMSSCILAIGVNWSTSKLLKCSSAISYIAIGQVKTCLTFIIDYVVFKQPFNGWNITGIVVAIVGLISYSITKHMENASTTTQVAGSTATPSVAGKLKAKEQ